MAEFISSKFLSAEETRARLAALIGDHVFSDELDPVNKTVDIEERLKDLEQYAREFVSVEGLSEDAIIQFRPIVLSKGNRIHSLLVDVFQENRRYTSALKKRLSLGLRDPKKWIEDLNEAVTIAITHKSVAVSALENRLRTLDKKRHTFGIDDEFADKYPGCAITVWRNSIMDIKGPAHLAGRMLIELLMGEETDEDQTE